MKNCTCVSLIWQLSSLCWCSQDYEWYVKSILSWNISFTLIQWWSGVGNSASQWIHQRTIKIEIFTNYSFFHGFIKREGVQSTGHSQRPTSFIVHVFLHFTIFWTFSSRQLIVLSCAIVFVWLCPRCSFSCIFTRRWTCSLIFFIVLSCSIIFWKFCEAF